MKFNWFIFVWSIVFLALIALVGIAELVEPETRDVIFKEGGPVETLSAAGYFAALALLLFQITKHRHTAGWSLCVMLLCFGLRELDFDKRFTTMGIFKSRFYLSSDVPINEKAIGMLIIMALLTCVFFLLRDHFPAFVRGIKERNTVPLTVFIALVFLVVSKSLDGIPRKLKPFGIRITDSTKSLAGILEESLETMAPFLLIVAIIGVFRQPMSNPDLIAIEQASTHGSEEERTRP